MARKKPTLAKVPWDFGTGTAAQRHNLTEEDAVEVEPETGKKRNPNNARRKRRMPVIEVYRKSGKITYEQYDAAIALLNAFEATQKRPPAIKEINVDSSPKPDQHIGILIDRIGNYHKFRRHVSSQYWAYVDHVVLWNLPIRSMSGCNGGIQQLKYMERLQNGLQDIAQAIKR